MVGAFALFGAALGDAPRLAERGGIFQRLSIATGLGWLSALSLRALGPARTPAEDEVFLTSKPGARFGRTRQPPAN
jgi:hypothetical protein